MNTFAVGGFVILCGVHDTIGYVYVFVPKRSNGQQLSLKMAVKPMPNTQRALECDPNVQYKVIFVRPKSGKILSVCVTQRFLVRWSQYFCRSCRYCVCGHCVRYLGVLRWKHWPGHSITQFSDDAGNDLFLAAARIYSLFMIFFILLLLFWVFVVVVIFCRLDEWILRWNLEFIGYMNFLCQRYPLWCALCDPDLTDWTDRRLI